MTPLQVAAGVTVVAAFIGGAMLGRQAVQSDWNAEKAAQARDVVKQLERSMERRAAADKVFADVQSAVNAALRSPRAPSEPIKCPPSGDVRDAVLPGLGDRLRAIDASANGRTPAGVAVVP